MHWPPPPEPGYAADEVVAGRDRAEVLRNLRALLHPNIPALAGARQADGENPLMPAPIRDALRGLNRFHGRMPPEAYAVMRNLGVQFLVTRWSRTELGRPVFAVGTHIYELPAPRPAAWAEPGGAGSVRAESRSPGRWEVAAALETGAVVVVNQSFVRGWRAMEGTRRRPVHCDSTVHLAVRLPAGRHRFRLVYQPVGPGLGLLLGGFLGSLLLSLGFLLPPAATHSSMRAYDRSGRTKR
jgi:hypothetical protein